MFYASLRLHRYLIGDAPSESRIASEVSKASRNYPNQALEYRTSLTKIP
jgi:hypothetical protein